KVLLSVIGLAAIALAGAASVRAAEEGEPELPSYQWPFNGVFGAFDRPAAKRGFQIYSEVCSNCHSLNLLSYRNLMELGFSEDEVKVIAAAKQVPSTDDNGEAVQRPALPSDHFVAPFANEKAARAANNGGLPPDLSLIVKAREGGPDYLEALLTGYGDPPADLKLPD